MLDYDWAQTLVLRAGFTSTDPPTSSTEVPPGTTYLSHYRPHLFPALQNLLSGKPEVVMSRLRDIVVQAHQLVALVSQYQNGVVMQSVLQDVANLSDLTAPSVVTKIERLEIKVSEFQVGTLDFADDECIAPLLQQLKEHLQAVLERQTADHKGKKDETVTPKATLTTIVNDSGFKIDLPSFSGKPIDWYKFHDLFVATMEKRGKHLSDPERCCLLLKAITTEEARSIVQKYEVEDDSYSQALKALTEAFGQPCQIYPQHVHALLNGDT